jgi:hypothetical protein
MTVCGDLITNGDRVRTAALSGLRLLVAVFGRFARQIVHRRLPREGKVMRADQT